MGGGLSKKKVKPKKFNTDNDDDHAPIMSRKTKRFSLFANENTIMEKTPSPQVLKKNEEDEENPSSNDSSISSLEDHSFENSKERENSLSNYNSFSKSHKKSHSSESLISLENEKIEDDSEQSLDPIKDFVDFLAIEPISMHTFISPRNDNIDETLQGFNSYPKGPNQLKKKLVLTSQLPDLNNEETNDEKKFVMQIVDFSKTVFKSTENNDNQDNHLHKAPAKYKSMEKDSLHELGINVISRKGSLSDTPNQDDYFIFIDQNFRIFSVFDGHGPHGHHISNICYRLLMKRLLEDPNLLDDPAGSLKTSFSKIVEDLKEYINHNKSIKKHKINMKFSGTTTTVIIQKDKTLYLAHLGDSRAVIGKKQKNKKSPYQLTTDHVPTLPQEKKRIYQNGGEVRKLNNDYVEKVFVRGRIYPGLSVSRSIGDEVAAFIGVIDEPEINVYEINEQTDQFLLLGSKPVFNYLEDYEIINILSSFSGKSVKMASDFLYKRVKSAWIQNENGFDDITLILVYL